MTYTINDNLPKKKKKKRENIPRDLVPCDSYLRAQSPSANRLATADIAALELRARALRKDLVTTHALCARGNRDPGDGKLLGAHADLPAVGRANGLTG